MFFSTYKSTRVLGNEFLRGPVLKFRAFAEGVYCRSWAAGAANVPTEIRIFMAGAVVIQYMSRWNTYRIYSEDTEMKLIRRHGGSVASLRQLSPADQVRARAYVESELWSVFLLPPHLRNKPAGYIA